MVFSLLLKTILNDSLSGELPVGGSSCWGICHLFSQDDVFLLYFHKFYLRSFKAEGVKFLSPTELEKIVRPRVKFVSLNWHLSPNWHFPQLTLVLTGKTHNRHFLQFFCAIENCSPPTAGTPSPVDMTYVW